MRQLIAASSLMEISPFLDKYHPGGNDTGDYPLNLSDNLLVMITGIGCPATVFNLTCCLKEDGFDRVIQVGIAGSYNPLIKTGSLVEVFEDRFADLGIDDRGSFLTIGEADLQDSSDKISPYGRLVNPLAGVTGLPLASSITVNTASGSELMIGQRRSGFNPDTETMEGAAAFYVCFRMNVPVIQVRAISNLVEPRDKSKWETKTAVEKLNKWLETFVIQ